MMKKTLLLLAFLGTTIFQANAQCDAGETEVTISILTDNYGSETTWTITGQGGTPVYGSGGPYANNQTYNTNVCVPDGPIIVFTIFDSYGDGICCGFGSGSYTVSANGSTVASGGQFGSSDETSFLTSDPVSYDLAVLSMNVNDVIAQGNQTISGSLKNFGTMAISSFTLNYSIDGGAPVTQAVTASVAVGATYGYNHSTPWNAAVGSHEVRVWASNLNGNADGNPLNDELMKTVSVATQSVQRKAMLEQFTSSTCGPCASLETSWGAPVLSSFNPNQTGSDIAVIKYHMNWPSPGNDPSYNPDGNTRKSYYGVSGIPDRFMDGAPFSSNSASGLTNAAARPAFASVAISYTMTWSTINVDVTVTPYADFAGTHRLFIAVTEDRYDYPASTTSQDVFKYVMRKILPNGNGILVSNLSAGVPQTFSQSYTFSGGSPAQGNYNLWTNLDNSTVVAFLQNMGTKDILNADFAPLTAPVGIEESILDNGLAIYPNPATDVLNVRFEMPSAGQVFFELSNAIGQRVLVSGQSFGSGQQLVDIDLSSLADGMYYLTMTSGGQRTTKAVSITR